MKFLKYFLMPFSWLYGAIMWLRNKMYDSGFLGSTDFNVPVITVGNLNTGGTGKTPHIEYLIRLLEEKYALVVLSRGYRRQTNGFFIAAADSPAIMIGDEPRMLKAKFPDINVAVGEERVMAIPLLMGRVPGTRLILMDDGYQHRAVKPWLNILLTSYHQPFWKDNLLPYGYLRESKEGYKRANMIIVTHCPMNLSPEEEKITLDQIQPTSRQKVFFSSPVYGTPYCFGDPSNKMPLDDTQSVLLFAGIGDALPLKNYVNTMVKKAYWMDFPDHYWYDLHDLEKIKSEFLGIENSNKIILTTEKDIVRLEGFRKWFEDSKVKFYVLPMGIKFVGSNAATFDTLVPEFVEYFFDKTVPMIDASESEHIDT